MEEDDEVTIKIGEKTAKILRGKEAKTALKAIQYVLDNVKSNKKIKIDIVDIGMPKNFSYAKVLLEALEYDLENPIEIADYILKKLKKANHTIS